jgi:four helix bundle suffix protein
MNPNYPNLPKHPNLPNHPNSESRPGYEYLTCYQLGLVIQELTEEFTKRWIESPRRRMQMDEASRSNPQNIAEGYTQPSLKGYIYLSGIAHGSNEELTKDFLRFLKQENLPIWTKEHPKIREFRAFRVKWISPTSLNTPKLPNNPQEAANMILTFCQMEGYILKRLVESLKEKHRTEGGLTEKLYRERKKYRGF